MLGRVKKQEYVEILRILRSMVSSGIAICPVSDMAFCELMRQTDDDTRRATSELFDELSLSVALQFEEYRIRCELEAFLLRPATPVKETLTDKIWTKASYVIGPQIPSIEGIPAEQQLLFQKSSIDLFWKRKFIDMADTSMASLDFEAIFDKKAAQINAVKNDYQHEIPSTKQALISEITGVADLFLDHAEAIIVAHGQRVRGRSFQSPTEAELQLVRKNIRNAMVNIFVYAKDKAKYMLPSMYAYALQHGAFRMDPNRKFRGSFLRDIHHGTAGVVWHDVMLTENPLKILLTQKNVALDRTFGCTVLSSPEEVLNYLRSLNEATARA